MAAVRKYLEIRNIQKRFGNVQAIRGVDLEVAEGEIVGLIGDNGAGKSTLIKIINGLFPADSGTIMINGVETRFASPAEARRNGIETVYQEEALADDLSIARNLFMGREPLRWFAGLRLLDVRRMRSESTRMLQELNLKVKSVDQETRYCSGGERQGIAIARSIYFNARLIILDEPTRALGVAAVQRVLQLILQLKTRGISCLFVSHNLNHIYPVADRIVVMIQGEKVKDIPKSETSVDELTQTLLQGTGMAR